MKTSFFLRNAALLCLLIAGLSPRAAMADVTPAYSEGFESSAQLPANWKTEGNVAIDAQEG